ncbi:uncharacterized protein LOC107643698 isoform X3 [Arachis ipaensis]|uniref:DUF7912 domain-containing protein n=1 Tax=Arachis hypogaea TaxID=3818 RepID=A0A444Z4C2_ARAHY|nr:uncharacterized protein LOC107643698 isoform X3 [Arachis ipaensis]XP_025654692.1 uncharacterized protein LOC112750271 isoform X3 [Arachis hypogaea]QHO12178.1 Ribosome maturation factor RimP [Arachis hypogaea]RYR09067.1 hypothetical protein Ahy_B05g077113 isoform B [Arachis hypogaea]
MGRAITKSMIRRMMMTTTKNSAVGHFLRRTSTAHLHSSPLFHLHNPSSLTHHVVQQKSHLCPFSSDPRRFFSISFSDDVRDEASEEGETTDDGWEEEDDSEPMIGDGGDGGGVALHNVPWGQRALSVAKDILKEFNEDIELYAFKTSPRGYVYVRLDKLTNEYGCPSMEELERYNQEYKKRLDEVGALGEIPEDLALEVSSPGAERILKVPDDLNRFQDMPMRVHYTENTESNSTEEDGVFLLESIEKESEVCVWKLADVKENRDPLRKGKPLSRKQKDWRLELPFNMHRMVTLYLD